MIVEPEPLRGIVLNHFDRVELVLAQPAGADCSIVAFDVGILWWLAWLDEIQLDAVPVRPLRILVIPITGSGFIRSSDLPNAWIR